MKEENLQMSMDDLDLAHKQAKRRIVKSGLHLDAELKPYLQCIASELAAAFTDGRQHQYKIDRTRLCEDRGDIPTERALDDGLCKRCREWHPRGTPCSSEALAKENK